MLLFIPLARRVLLPAEHGAEAQYDGSERPASDSMADEGDVEGTNGTFKLDIALLIAATA
jgi:hypothetical protein